jgi:hypothetical protein
MSIFTTEQSQLVIIGELLRDHDLEKHLRKNIYFSSRIPAFRRTATPYIQLKLGLKGSQGLWLARDQLQRQELMIDLND